MEIFTQVEIIELEGLMESVSLNKLHGPGYGMSSNMAVRHFSF